MKKLSRSFDEIFRDIEAIRSPLKKIEEAKRLLEEARAEVAALFGGKLLRAAPSKKRKPAIEISYKAPVIEIGNSAEMAVARVFKGAMTLADIVQKTKLPHGRVRNVLREMGTRGLAYQEGKGRNSVWVRQ